MEYPPVDLQFVGPLAVRLGFAPEQIGLVLVDHGSRREESNAILLDVVDMFRRQTGLRHVEAAHMELAAPTLADAFTRLVQQGVRLVIVQPYFLGPGRHWSEDIPRLAASAAKNHPGVKHLVTAPLGVHPLMAQIIADRVEGCLRHVVGDLPGCDVCLPQGGCDVR